jgi:hypothetical protein
VDTSGDRIKVASWNLGWSVEGDKGAAVAALAPDVLLAQEVTDSAFRSILGLLQVWLTF